MSQTKVIVTTKLALLVLGAVIFMTACTPKKQPLNPSGFTPEEGKKVHERVAKEQAVRSLGKK